MGWAEHSMRTKGRLRSWNHDWGFGFVEPSDGRKNVFLHISAFRNRDRRPEVGQIVTYALSTDSRGRPQAVRATLPGDSLSRPKKRNGKAGAVIVAAGFFSLVAFSVVSGRLPFLIFYAFDKVAAKDGAWRISESTLHLLSLGGGWPGAQTVQVWVGAGYSALGLERKAKLEWVE